MAPPFYFHPNDGKSHSTNGNGQYAQRWFGNVFWTALTACPRNWDLLTAHKAANSDRCLCHHFSTYGGNRWFTHVIVRFFTKKVSDARKSAGIALLCIAILYTTAPAVAVFARTNLIETVSEQPYESMPQWFKNWENRIAFL